MGIIWSILIGIAAGFIAGKLMKGRGFGLVLNLILGLVGGVVGGWLFGAVGLGARGLLGELICSTIGAVALIWIASLFKGK